MAISEDLFTGDDTSPLSGRLATDGVNTWTNLTLSLGQMSILANKAIFSSGDYGVWFLSGAATTDGEFVEAAVDFKSLIATNGIAARMTTGGSGYVFVYHVGGAQWRLYRLVGSGFTQLSAGGSAPSLGLHTLRVAVTGTGASVSIACTVDGVAPFPAYSDTAGARLTTPGRAGLYGEGIASSTTGIHFDSIKLEDGVAAAASISGTITLDDIILSGAFASQPPSSMTGTLQLADIALSGAFASQPGTLTVPQLTNWAGSLLAAQLVENVVAIRISDRALLAAWTNQTADGGGNLPLTHAALVPGTLCMVLGFNADGSQRFARPVTVA